MAETEKTNIDYQTVIKDEISRLKKNLDVAEEFRRILDKVKPNQRDAIELGRALGSVAVNITSLGS